MWGNLIAAGSSLLGGLISSNTAQNNADKNTALQREFAQNGIRWKVEDAKKAGIHPLYALGANTHSFAPVSVGGGMGPALASMGQDVGRAINATQTAPERMSAYSEAAQKLQLDNMSLQNQLLASRVATLNQAGGNPPLPNADATDFVGPMPAIPEEEKDKKRPRLRIGGENWNTDSGTSNAEEFETRYGDEGPASWIAGLAVGAQDLFRNYGRPETWPKQAIVSLWNRLSNEAKEEYGNFQRFVEKLNREYPMRRRP